MKQTKKWQKSSMVKLHHMYTLAAANRQPKDCMLLAAQRQVNETMAMYNAKERRKTTVLQQ